LRWEAILSSTKSEYIAILEAFRVFLLPLMDLLEDAKVLVVPKKIGAPVVHCKAFKDNSGALEQTQLWKLRPQSWHVSVKYHYFCEAVAKRWVTVKQVPSMMDQLGDLLTKNLQRDLFVTLWKEYMEW
jgi:hypothetical protein